MSDVNKKQMKKPISLQLFCLLFCIINIFSSCGSQDEKPVFSVEETYLEMMQTDASIIAVHNYNKELQLINNNPDIINATMTDKGLSIDGISPGKASITIVDKESDNSIQITVKVVSPFIIARLLFEDVIDPLFEEFWPVEIYLMNNERHDFYMMYVARPIGSGRLLYSGTYHLTSENGVLRYLTLTGKNNEFQRRYDLWHTDDMSAQNAALDVLDRFCSGELKEHTIEGLELYEVSLNESFVCELLFKEYRIFPYHIIEE